MSNKIKQDVLIESYDDDQSVLNEELLCDQSFIEATINYDRLKVSLQVYKTDNFKGILVYWYIFYIFIPV